MPGSRRGAYSTLFLPPWFILFLSRGGPPKPFIPASYSHKDIKKKTQQKELLGRAVKCFIRKQGGGRLTLSVLARRAWFLRDPQRPRGNRGHRGARGQQHTLVHTPAQTLARTHAGTGRRVHVRAHVGVRGSISKQIPNHCAPSKGPSPLSSGRDALGSPRGSFFVPMAEEASFCSPPRQGPLPPAIQAPGSPPPSELRVG